MDETVSLYEHLKHRLATGYNYGDDNTSDDPDCQHRCSSQSVREDVEGDVGIFEYNVVRVRNYDGISSHTLWDAGVQIIVICNNGDIEGAKHFLLASFNNFVNDSESSNVYIENVRLNGITPAGKNKDNKQMVYMNTDVFFYINSDEVNTPNE